MIDAKVSGLVEPAAGGPVGSRRGLRGRPNFFSDTCFHAAVQEMGAIGLRVRLQPHPGSEPYGVLSGRTGSRFFLIPARPRAVSAGSLALVQPVRFAPRAAKGLATAAARLGLTGFLLPRKVHISGSRAFLRKTDCGAGHSAFLTGTPGPHRKLSVQLMDGAGRIKGYAKVSLAPAVHLLLAHEADMLRLLGAINLSSALIPRVLLNEMRTDVAVLATDTVRTTDARCLVDLHPLHLDVLEELATRTASEWARSGESLLVDWASQIQRIASHLSLPWRQRFDRALKVLAAEPQLIASRGLAHGDFTPVNSFRQGGRLCVFDWEYAGDGYPADYDLICFLDAVARLHGARPVALANILERRLQGLGRSLAEANRRLIAFFCVYALRGASRQPLLAGQVVDWSSADHEARILDSLLDRACAS